MKNTLLWKIEQRSDSDTLVDVKHSVERLRTILLSGIWHVEREEGEERKGEKEGHTKEERHPFPSIAYSVPHISSIVVGVPS